MMQTFQISKKHGIVLVPDAPAIQNLFPDLPRLTLNGKPSAAVPFTPPHAFMLQKMGYEVPAPILQMYDWPGERPPFEVQKKTCAMLTMNQRAYVLNDLGTGKTKTALWAFDYLKKLGLAHKLLVVAPLSTLTFTWSKEVFKTVPHLKCTVLHHYNKERRLKLLEEDADIYVINHDGVKIMREALDQRADIDAIVIDEMSLYRNGTSDRTKNMRAFVKSKSWAWAMTGRPIPNSPTDVWAQASIITPDNVPRYFGRFRDEIMTRVNQYKWAPKPDAVEKAFAVLQPSVRYSLDDVVELPQLIERTVDVEMGVQQDKTYKDVMRKCYAMVGNKEITAANAGVAMSKLLQISSGWVYAKGQGVVSLDNDKRIEAVVDIINDTDKKVLAFVNFKHALDGLSKALDAEKIEHAVVSGDTAAGKRADIFNTFQNTDKYKVLLAHPACLAHGITLTAATTAIWVSPVLDLETFDQANARIRRVGQTNKQQIIMLQGTPVERRVYSMLRSKQRIQEQLLQLFEDASA